MNKRSIPIAVVSCILALAGLAGYVFVDAPEAATPSRLLMENAGGRVVFTHQAHSTPGGAYGDNNCAVCHHELKINAEGAAQQPPGAMACKNCHGTADDPDFIQSHQSYYRDKGGDRVCASCHHTLMSGFSDKWNHEEHWDHVGDCATCHHDAQIEAKNGRTINVKPQKCANCHTAKTNPLTDVIRKDAGHQRCEPCHSDLFDAGPSGCATCHGQKKTADLLARGENAEVAWTSCSNCHEPILGGMDAFHKQCMGCHDKAGKGPGSESKDGLNNCKQCHRS